MRIQFIAETNQPAEHSYRILESGSII